MLLGLDIGSSSVKAALVDQQSKEVIAQAQFPSREMKMISLHEGWAEQHPEEWWTNVIHAINLLFKDNLAKKKELKAIGISYQMHGLVAIDKDGEVVRPSIIWCDSRAIQIGEEAFEQIGKESCLNSLLNSPGNFTASKLKWVQLNEPEIYEKIDKVMLPGDYIAYRFTGEKYTSNTGLSEGIFYDFQKDRLSEKIMDHFGFARDLIPTQVPVFSNQGQILPEIAIELGFSKDCIVSYRAGDQPNNAFALNVREPGEIAATAGTSGVVYGISDQLKFDPENRVNSFAHVNHRSENKRIGILLCVNGTGSAYSWLRNNLVSSNSYFELEEEASKIEIGSEKLAFLPFGNGAERMLGNRLVGAHYHNLQFNTHKKGHLIRSCLEGIAFSLVYGIVCMEVLGLKPKKIIAGNDNMFQSSIFSTTIATLTNTEIQLKETTGAIGAALGAGFGAGIYSDYSSVFSNEKKSKTYYPDLQHKDQYLEAYSNWFSYLKLNESK